jgi:F0F1-type ATP synthase membrane subunit b/b'
LHLSSKVRNTLESKMRTLQADLEAANGQLEEEAETKLELQKQLYKLQDDYKLSKEQYSKECQAKIDEVEDSKLAFFCYKYFLLTIFDCCLSLNEPFTLF